MEQPNIMWYEDDNLSIVFNTTPFVAVRYITPSMTEEEKKSIKKYPFINKRELWVTIFDRKKQQVYKFSIPKGYCYDGASIPKVFHPIIGSNTDNKFLIPALVHDVLCEHHNYINNNRSLSTNVFNALLFAGDVNPVKRCLMKNSVACFQTMFCSWGKK